MVANDRWRAKFPKATVYYVSMAALDHCFSALRRVNPRGRDKRGSFLKLCGQGKEGAKK